MLHGHLDSGPGAQGHGWCRGWDNPGIRVSKAVGTGDCYCCGVWKGQQTFMNCSADQPIANLNPGVEFSNSDF